MQTDTTVGLQSQNAKKLKEIKSRDSKKPFIKLYKNFNALQADARRVPNSRKNRVRRSTKTTYIVKNIAFRVADDTLHSSLLRSIGWNYSTSANESGKNFDRDFCEVKTDIIIENKISLYEGESSSLYKMNSKKIKRLR
ncbi:MAG: Sua5/YciO/YrdC/YwlC family protein [Campylobacterota bacterium]|nr:Sua5/YciO/YrdC/YwlC family protein [Campylobacterota bacterium]